jgi:hypothetical protein
MLAAMPLELAIGIGAVHRYCSLRVMELEVWHEPVVDAGNQQVRKAKESNDGGRIITNDWERGDPGYEVIKNPHFQRGVGNEQKEVFHRGFVVTPSTILKTRCIGIWI